MLSRLLKVTNAHIRWIAAGRPLRSSDEILRIYDEHCVICEKFRKDWCRICGCRLKRSGTTLNKIAWGTESCPYEPSKWAATHKPTEETVANMSGEDMKEIKYEEGKPTTTIPSAQARKKAQGDKPRANGCCD